MALISRKLLKVRPQELGKIKIGGKGRLIERGDKSFRVPVKYDHFEITTRVRDEKTENFVRDERIHQTIGEAPTELHGLLMYAEPEENFHSEMCVYRGRTQKVLVCNGEIATNLNSGKSAPCRKAAGEECPCKPYARLHLQLAAAGDMLGYHVFRTTSWESTNNIQTALEELHRTFRTCYHAPVKLVLYPSEDVHDGKISTSHKVGLVLAMSMEEAANRIAAARQYAELASGEIRQLAAGVQEDLAQRDVEEGVDIADEFFPPPDNEIRAIEISNALDAADDPEPTPPTNGGRKLTPQDLDPDFDYSDEEREPAQSSEPDPTAPAPKDNAQDDRLRRLNAQYFVMLAERGMESDSDRKPWQERLCKAGLISAPSCTQWNRQDYVSAIAELHDIPTVSEEVPDNDDDLFQG